MDILFRLLKITGTVTWVCYEYGFRVSINEPIYSGCFGNAHFGSITDMEITGIAGVTP